MAELEHVAELDGRRNVCNAEVVALRLWTRTGTPTTTGS
jgi:hypothetical protein